MYIEFQPDLAKSNGVENLPQLVSPLRPRRVTYKKRKIIRGKETYLTNL